MQLILQTTLFSNLRGEILAYLEKKSDSKANKAANKGYIENQTLQCYWEWAAFTIALILIMPSTFTIKVVYCSLTQSLVYKSCWYMRPVSTLYNELTVILSQWKICKQGFRYLLPGENQFVVNQEQECCKIWGASQRNMCKYVAWVYLSCYHSVCSESSGYVLFKQIHQILF